jgi:hypothetical protein
MNQSHLSAASHHGRPDTPCSLNYVSANTHFQSRPKRQPTIILARATTSDDAISPFTVVPTTAPVSHVRSGRRVQLRAKARTAFKHAKKGLRMVSALVRSGSSGATTSAASIANLKRAESRLSMHTRQSVIEPPAKRASTPSVCLTKPTYKGTNVRLSIHQAAAATQISLPSYRETNVRLSVHQAPATPEVPQTFLFDADSSDSDSEHDKRKSMRFQHPVVNGVIAGPSALNCDSSGGETSDGESISVLAGTPMTVATMEFEDQVNPKLMFRHSRAVSAGQSFDAFKNAMDGVAVKTMPRATVQPPYLPYIPLALPMQLDDGKDNASVKTVMPAPESPVLPASLTVKFADVVHPNTLAIGSGVPLSKPRTTAARPHTTGEVGSSAQFLPCTPFGPRFNPYDRALTPSPTPAPVSPKRAADDLAVAFAEAEAAERAVRHKRHTTLYEEIEGGSLPAAPLAPAAPVHKIKRKAVPTARAPETSKPLPPVPAPGSPRRYTQGFVPPVLAMNDNDYFMFDRPARREQQQQQKQDSEQTEKGKCVKRSASHKARAVDRALRKLYI